LLRLDASDFFLVRAYNKHGRPRAAPQFRKIVGDVNQHAPANACTAGRARHLRKCRSARRLKNDGIGPQSGIALNGAQNLCALGNGVVAGEQDLQIHRHGFGSSPGRGRLFQLKVVLLCYQRQQNAALGWQLNSPGQDELNSRSVGLEYTCARRGLDRDLRTFQKCDPPVHCVLNFLHSKGRGPNWADRLTILGALLGAQLYSAPVLGDRFYLRHNFLILRRDDSPSPKLIS
jgi:hypothetical protein